MKIVKLFLLVTIITLITCNPIHALTYYDFPPGTSVPPSNININTNLDGSFFDLSYIVSSSAATSGIRYRTSAITIAVGPYKATINLLGLGGMNGSPSLYTNITISKLDIIQSIGMEHEDEINSLLVNASSNVLIGANIQIYNAGTGSILATIKNRADVASIAGNIGFGQQDINDMKTRWQVAPGNPVNPPQTPSNPGLRPSILVP